MQFEYCLARHGRRARAGLLTVAMLALLGVFPAQAATRTVTSLGDTTDPNDGVLTLREAIATAGVGDTIDFTVSGTIFLYQELGLARDLNIANTGPGTITLTRANNAIQVHRFFNVTSGTVTISNLIMENGYVEGDPNDDFGNGGPGEGGAVLVGPDGTLTLTHCILRNNYARGGLSGKYSA